jgi:hypothetical protein
MRSPDSSVSLVTRQRDGHPRNRGSVPSRGKRFISFPNVRTGPQTHSSSRVQTMRSPDSSVSLVTRRDGHPRNRGSIPSRGKRFISFPNVRTGPQTHSASRVQTMRSPDSSVSLVTRQRDGHPRNRGSIPSRGKRFISFPKVRTGPQTHSASYSAGTETLSSGVRSPEREAAHTPPNAEVENEWTAPRLQRVHKDFTNHVNFYIRRHS